ncbi:hypothetical protein MIZ01_2144 [Sideroxyarcus emersonii]|uniref:DUF3619 family protein n=1 Tax=Sideroxyarcus emersonii TaxID=2764705 RepID=A0AAN2BZR4_9PROT|nr:DUF3619 family protein [Sideroxyarcus emersonii]BCK88341.1 hypothetical protein MIZ01_2144 [Sideroxyarcus emersonii]
MNTKLTTGEIGRLLDQSARQLDRRTLDQLVAARQHALQNQRVSVSTWVSQNGMLHGRLQLSARALNWIIAAVVASLLVINVTYWSSLSERDHSDIDIAILTDDLPVDMYVD